MSRRRRFCLDRYVRTTWAERPDSLGDSQSAHEEFQSFLANGVEEALSGALKLARYDQSKPDARASCLILDPADRLAGFAFVDLAGGERVEFLPGVRMLGGKDLGENSSALDLGWSDPSALVLQVQEPVSVLVLVAHANAMLEIHAAAIRSIVERDRPLVVTCVDHDSLLALRAGKNRSVVRDIMPDIVVFDESFVNHEVPFAAFSARKSLFAHWNRARNATFHSTTFQPNTISTLQFMNCVARFDSEFHALHADELQGALSSVAQRGDWFARYYNPSLYRLIRATGCATSNVRAAGSFLFVDGRSIFDGVSGVACSIRGHNPPTYAGEMKSAGVDKSRSHGTGVNGSERGDISLYESELCSRLEALTGLDRVLPAVSGATAVENALKMALVARFPRKHVLALKAGFGGKTLLALTGTANPAYKQRIEPLYAHVHFVDPFAPDVLERIDALLQTHDFAVVQTELIQGVGGVRRVPEPVLRHLDAGRKQHGYLLLVDEIQTGMYRTGPFVVARALGLQPDFLLLGKATSDMMFPFALTLYTSEVETMLEHQGSNLAALIRKNFGYEHGYKTAVNVLRMAEDDDLPRQVAAAGELFENLLGAGLASCRNVREVRVYGLLLGIELDARRMPQRWIRKRLSSFYLLRMLRHESFPVFAGFCQCEPNVLKITPPLNVSTDEIRQCCGTLVDVLNRPAASVVASGLAGLVNSFLNHRGKHEHRSRAPLELSTR